MKTSREIHPVPVSEYSGQPPFSRAEASRFAAPAPSSPLQTASPADKVRHTGAGTKSSGTVPSSPEPSVNRPAAVPVHPSQPASACSTANSAQQPADIAKVSSCFPVTGVSSVTAVSSSASTLQNVSAHDVPPAISAVQPTAGTDVTVPSIEDLKNILPFSPEIPSWLPVGYRISSISAINGKIAQIFYSNGTGTILFQTARGPWTWGNSGPAGNCTAEMSTGNAAVSLKKDASGIRSAQWEQDGYSFSLLFSSGMNKDTVCAIVKSMKA